MDWEIEKKKVLFFSGFFKSKKDGLKECMRL